MWPITNRRSFVLYGLLSVVHTLLISPKNFYKNKFIKEIYFLFSNFAARKLTLKKKKLNIPTVGYIDTNYMFVCMPYSN